MQVGAVDLMRGRLVERIDTQETQLAPGEILGCFADQERPEFDSLGLLILCKARCTELVGEKNTKEIKEG